MDFLARFPDFDLPPGFDLDGLHDEFDRVDVLDFAAGAEALTRFADRDIDVGAHGALVHIAIAGAEIAQDLPQFGDIGAGLFGAAHIGFGDDLHQRHAGAVEVDEGFARVLVMLRLAGILFEMQAGDADDFLRAIIKGDLDLAGAHDGVGELADLIALRQVGVEVILPVEARPEVDLGIQAKTGAHGLGHAFGVDGGQHAGEAGIDERHLAIGRGAEGGGRAGEEFGL